MTQRKPPEIHISNCTITSNPVSEETIIVARTLESIAKAALALAERIKAPITSYGSCRNERTRL